MDHRQGGTSGHLSGARGTAVQVGLVLFVALFVLEAYAFVHEAGHALVGLIFGGTLTSFSINIWNLAAHVGIEGQFSDAQRSLISLAGAGTALALWAALTLLVPGTIDAQSVRANAALVWLRLVGSLACINTLLAWIALPVLFLQNQAPPDDVTTFLERSHLSPLLVSATALALWLACWALFLHRSGGVRSILSAVRNQEHRPLAPASVATLRNLAAVGVVLAVLAVGGDSVFTRTGAVGLPPEYQLVAVVDLSTGGRSDETVYQFTVERPEAVSLYFLLQNLEVGPAEIALVGHNGYRNVFLRFGAEYAVGRATVHPQDLPLPPGEYEVRFTFPQNPGRVSLYVKRGG